MKLFHPSTIQSRFLAAMAVAALLIGGLFAAGFYLHMRQILEHEVRDKAEIVFHQVDAIQHYVRSTLRPTMYQEMPEKFVIEAMSSSYVSRKVTARAGKGGGPRLYRRVAVGARNPDFEANTVEMDLINHFRSNPEEPLWQGYKEIDDEKHFVMARPVRFKESCLRCHGDPADAPPELLDKYGERGFGHELGAVDGLDFVGLPVSASVSTIRSKVMAYLLIFCLSALLFLAAVHLVFKRVVSDNLRSLTSIFRRHFTDAKGERLLRDIESRDELSSMVEGMEMLGEHLYDTRRRLSEYASKLEVMVDDRTRELARQFEERQADVELFVRLLAGLNSSQTRGELWKRALPRIAERFDLARAGYVCGFSLSSFHAWPDPERRPELPDNWKELLTESKPHIEQHAAFIPVESGEGSPEGLLCLWTKPDGSFTDEDAEVLRALGRQLGIAAENLGSLDSLLRHTANLQAIFEGIRDPLLLLDSSGHVVVRNQAARDLARELGLGTAEEPDDASLVPHLCAGTDEGTCDIPALALEGRYLAREVNLDCGRSFLLRFHPVPGGPESGGRLIVSARETTAEKRMLSQINRSEKLATVGKLAAGLAHEINNPLGVILCYAELIKQGTGQGKGQEAARDDVEVIIKHTRQAQRVLRDLLNFARPKVATDQATELRKVVGEVAQVFSVQAAKKSAELRLECSDDLPPVGVEPQVVEHIAANLILNALDAVPDEGGVVRLRATLDENAREVVLSVDDNGPGIPEEDLGNVFDPFFSTKEVNQGTGLGLTVIYAFMSDLGGGVEASRSDLGGARIELRFPLDEARRTEGAA